MERLKLRGIPVSPGIALGNAYIVDFGVKFRFPLQKINPDEVEKELNLFEYAIERATKRILEIKAHTQQNLGEDYANIFAAQLMILEDSIFKQRVEENIRKEHLSAKVAVSKALHEWLDLFASLPDKYHKERALDIYDVGRHLFFFLTGKTVEILWKDIPSNSIVVAHSLAPSDTVLLPRDKVAGFVCDVGSKTSHTAIIAKALEIPSVVGLHEISYRVKEGDFLIVDGCWGEVIINPDEEEKARYKNNKAEFHKLRDRLSQLSCYIPGRTKEGFRIPIRGNLESHIEIELLKKEGAEGIGLYRTEFLFLNRLNLPTEEEQFEAYKEVVERFNPNPVTIRTVDLGGDKFLSPAKTPLEINPLLGVRAIRFCLKNKEIFLTQLKAILRASAYGKVQILLPLITREEEIKETKELIKEAMEELRSRNIKFEEHLPIGIMLETPAAALTVDILAPHVDFFSLGTNDLIQYVFAVDRSNEEMNDLLEPYHPSIIRLIKGVIETAHSYGKEVGICGELASEPAYAVLLAGMGLDELSMSGISIMKVKEVLKRISLEEAYNLACNTLNSKNLPEIKEMLAPYEK